MRRVKSSIGLNRLSIRIGFFAVKNVGILFQNIENISMEGQENQIPKK